jgi:homoserine trans-succinylase
MGLGTFLIQRRFPGVILQTYKPQLKNGWKSTEADKMGQWKAFWNLLGFTQRVSAQVDFCWNAAADVYNVDGVSREDAKVRRRRKKEVSVSREDAKTRRVGIEFRSCPRRFVAMRVSWSAPA